MSEPSKLWTPDTELAFMGNTLEQIVVAYSEYLRVREPLQHTLFQLRLKDDPDAAKSEAAVFSWLRSQKLAPSINEKPGQTGADFMCSPKGSSPFLLEVTCLNANSVESKSKWFAELKGLAGKFVMVTPQLQVKANSKVRQLSIGTLPGVLAVCVSHPSATALLSTLAAAWLMVSEPKIEVPIPTEDGENPHANLVTDLRYSVFLDNRDGEVVTKCKSISAVLLIALWDKHLEIVGLLHPEPIVPFDYRSFPRVPFARIEWPLKDSIHMEWVIADPSAASCEHRKVTFTNDELTGQ